MKLKSHANRSFNSLIVTPQRYILLVSESISQVLLTEPLLHQFPGFDQKQ